MRTEIKQHIIISEQTFVYATELEKGNGTMSENELKVLQLINMSNDKEKAVKVALALLESFLVRPDKILADLREVS